LFDGTPLAVERVVAIWPGLTVAENASLLPGRLEKHTDLNHASHRNRLLELALADNNDFIRYIHYRPAHWTNFVSSIAQSSLISPP